MAEGVEWATIVFVSIADPIGDVTSVNMGNEAGV